MGSNGLTSEDMARIQAYLEKPPHRRRIETLIPDEDDSLAGRESSVPSDLAHED